MTSYPLEPDRAAMRAMTEAAFDVVAGFVEDLPKAPAVEFADDERLVTDLRRPPPDVGGDPTVLLRTFRQAAGQGVDTAGPGYFAFVPGGGLFTSALAEFPARAVNRYTGFAGFAPALVAIEEGVLGWLRGQFGLPPGGAGLTTTGGSTATLAAVVAARTERLGDDFGGGTLYVTAHTHRCVAKAARIAGLRTDAIRVVPTTPQLRMDPAAALDMITADRAAGRRPFLLVATAGTTDTGTVDPLPELADQARRNGLWFHVDAAYGGFFVLTERGRARLAGIERADSLVLDPHKGMFLPYGTGVLLARDAAALHAAHTADGHYLQDAGGGDSGLPDYADLGPELTREYRGLRLWFPLQVHGVAAFRAALDEKLDLAEAAHCELAADPLLELPWQPDLSTVVFRLRGERDAPAVDNERNRRLLERVNASRRVHLSSTLIAGRYHLRLCVLSHRTHREHVAEAVEIIRRAAKAERPSPRRARRRR